MLWPEYVRDGEEPLFGITLTVAWMGADRTGGTRQAVGAPRLRTSTG